MFNLNMEYNLYNIQVLREWQDKIKKHVRTLDRKISHKAMVGELHKLLTDASSETGATFVNPDYAYGFSRYADRVNLYYDNTTKSELDKFLGLALKSVFDELGDCIKIERDIMDGILVPDPRQKGCFIDREKLEG